MGFSQVSICRTKHLRKMTDRNKGLFHSFSGLSLSTLSPLYSLQASLGGAEGERARPRLKRLQNKQGPFKATLLSDLFHPALSPVSSHL